MATYVFRCKTHGDADVSAPMGSAPEMARCPDCGAAARRVFSAPLLGRRQPRLVAEAIDRAERSADTPDVVATPPAARRRPATPANPARARLPRP